MSTQSLPEILEKLLNGLDLDKSESINLMKSWLNEEIEPVQTGAFLAAFRSKGVSGEELTGMAGVLQDSCKLPFSIPQISMVDTCGTGGDGANTFNISTAVAFVSAACGATVAKHGNRSASGKIGSADVLEALGLPLNAPSQNVINAIENVQVTFLFAPAWHSSLVNLAPLRKRLGVRTIFNLLGPLVNPLRPQSQVLGVAKENLLGPMSEALLGLGLKRAVVVYGAGGLDEASLEGPNDMRFISDGKITSSKIDPRDIGLSYASVNELQGGDLATNKQILKSLLQGNGTNAQKDIVAFNTSLVLWSSGIENDLRAGVSKSLECLNSPQPWNIFESLRNTLELKN